MPNSNPGPLFGQQSFRSSFSPSGPSQWTNWGERYSLWKNLHSTVNTRPDWHFIGPVATVANNPQKNGSPFIHTPPCDLKIKDSIVRRICIVDFTKLGTMSKESLDWCIGLAEKILKVQPSNSCAVIVAPWLVSDSVEDGADGERKNIEQKCKNRNLKTFPITLHGSRRLLGNASKRPLFYCAWVALPIGTECPKGENRNVFLKCPLLVDRGNDEAFSMIPESEFLTPENGVAGLARGSTAEDESVNRVRGVGYSRNITGGESYAKVILQSVQLPGDTSRHLYMANDIAPCQGFLQARTFLNNIDETTAPNNPNGRATRHPMMGGVWSLPRRPSRRSSSRSGGRATATIS